MVKKKEKKYINIKIRYYTLNHKIHKKISLGEYSSLRKKKTNHFNLGNQKKTLGVKQQGEYIIRVIKVCLW